jgi:Uncharacterized protein conserved in bacteria (DUF2171)
MADTMADRMYLGRITPGMDVCDVTGEKVGSISHIYHLDESTAGTAPTEGTAPESTPARTGEEILEVKTGFLGLGKHWYIPISAVQEVLTDSIFLSKSRDAFKELGYENKPEHLAEAH